MDRELTEEDISFPMLSLEELDVACAALSAVLVHHLFKQDMPALRMLRLHQVPLTTVERAAQGTPYCVRQCGAGEFAVVASPDL